MKKNQNAFPIISTAGAIIVVVLSILFVFERTTSTIVNNNVKNMTEIASHDMQSINNSLESRFSTLHVVAKEFKKEKTDTISQAISLLQENIIYIADAKRLELLSDEGVVYSQANLIAKDPLVEAFCKGRDTNIAVRYNKDASAIERKKEFLMLAIPVDITVEGIHMTHLAVFLDIESIKTELKITSYGGAGFSSIIDEAGNYIVNVDESHSYFTFDNFFNDLTEATSQDFSSPDELKAIVSAISEPKAITYTIDGIEHIMSVSPFGNLDWLFITDIPLSVFHEQSNIIMESIYMLVIIICVVVIAVVILLARQRRQREKLYFAEERNKGLETIERQNKELEKQQEALEQALDLANSANRAKTTFLNSMSHDIRTPMNAIIGYTGLAASHIDNRELLQSYLGKISQSSNHLLSLINDVLDMSRIESGKMTLNEKPESLAEILHTLRDIIHSNVTAKELDFFMDTNDVTHETVICDKLRLNQVLLNVLSNAIKYTQPGGTVAMRLYQKGVTESGYGSFEFRIKDNGMGMSKEFLKTIYEPFTRVKTSTVSGIQGTGLGMAITKNIVDMMGGTIDIESEEGKGTEVILNFEFKLQDTARKPFRIAQLEGMRGLVVDDDPNASVSVSRMLKDIGIRSDWCLSGKEAVFRTETAMQDGDLYKVYIIDWLMPDMNGIETTRRIRKVVGDNVPIIVLTAYDWSDIEEEAREAGVTGFISKPMFQSDLNNVLCQCCGVTPEAKQEEEHFDFAGKKVLLVEDNEMNREIATEVLEEGGFIVDTAEDGTFAVEKMAAAKPGDYDLILMDVQMPLMDGYEATRRIRSLADPAVAGITIIAMTANAFEEDRQAALEAGMNDHLTKPVDVKKLNATLAKHLGVK